MGIAWGTYLGGNPEIREDHMKRQRGRNRRSSGGQSNNINRHFESNGPDVKIRGSAQQVLDKYLQYAREAQTNGDRVKSEAFFQHAEHYQRTLAVMLANQKPKRDRDEQRSRDQQDNGDADDAEAEVETSEEKVADDGTSGEDQPKDKRDPLRVIGDDESSAVSEDDQSAADAKPKRSRRRTYKKREEGGDEGDSPAEEADGVMKTLSRGRKPARSAGEESAEPADDAPQEAAAK